MDNAISGRTREVTTDRVCVCVNFDGRVFTTSLFERTDGTHRPVPSSRVNRVVIMAGGEFTYFVFPLSLWIDNIRAYLGLLFSSTLLRPCPSFKRRSRRPSRSVDTEKRTTDSRESFVRRTECVSSVVSVRRCHVATNRNRTECRT